MRPLLAVLAAVLALAALAPGARAQHDVAPPAINWRFDGVFGTWDLPAIRRGFHVYSEVCAACHSLNLMAYRHLAWVGFTEEEILAIAGAAQVEGTPTEEGDPATRPAIAADQFAPPFPNEQAARYANNGALPPDLSVMANARPNGPDYLYAFLTGFVPPPEGVELMPGMHWNVWFPGNQTAMMNVLADGGVTYPDGTPATIGQQAADVTNFLMWAAEPHLAERKQTGVKVFLFILVFTGMMYAVKRKVWADIH